MKILKILTLFFGLVVLFSCGNDYENNFDLEELPGYVAFDAPGTSVNLEDVAVAEDDGSTSVKIECPTGTLSDITVEYSLSGDAVLGEDYNIAGVSGSSGTIVLKVAPADFQNNDNVDLTIELISDDLEAEPDKTLTITLVSASNDEGPIAVGRGGTDFLKSINIIISDSDCVSSLAGTFDAVTTIDTVSSMWGTCMDTSWTGIVRWEKIGLTGYKWYSMDANNPEAEDFSLGAFYTCMGDGVATPAGDLLCNEICGVLSFSGTTATLQFTSVSADSTDLTIGWVDGDGRAASTVLVRQDGTDWPALGF